MNRGVARVCAGRCSQAGTGLRFRPGRIVLHGIGELAVDVAPLAHARLGEEVRFAETPQRIARCPSSPAPAPRARYSAGRGNPNRDRRRRDAPRRPASFCSSGRSRGSGTLSPAAMIEHLRQRLLLPRLEQHAAERGIDRQPRQFAPERRQFVRVIERAEFVQERVARADGGGVRAD